MVALSVVNGTEGEKLIFFKNTQGYRILISVCSYLSHLFLVSLVNGYVLLFLARSGLTLTVSPIKLMDSSCKKGGSV
jgi:hypothetical protein